MSAEQERRATIITCPRAGRAPNEIIEFTKIPKSTVFSKVPFTFDRAR
jgi:hypothetical protein